MIWAFLKRAAATIGTIASWVYTILDFALHWTGRSTADDASQLVNEKLPAWAEWLFSTPSWVSAACAMLLTAWPIRLSRPSAAGRTALNTPFLVRNESWAGPGGGRAPAATLAPAEVSSR